MYMIHQTDTSMNVVIMPINYSALFVMAACTCHCLNNCIKKVFKLFDIRKQLEWWWEGLHFDVGNILW